MCKATSPCDTYGSDNYRAAQPGEAHKSRFSASVCKSAPDFIAMLPKFQKRFYQGRFEKERAGGVRASASEHGEGPGEDVTTQTNSF